MQATAAKYREKSADCSARNVPIFVFVWLKLLLPPPLNTLPREIGTLRSLAPSVYMFTGAAGPVQVLDSSAGAPLIVTQSRTTLCARLQPRVAPRGIACANAERRSARRSVIPDMS